MLGRALGAALGCVLLIPFLYLSISELSRSPASSQNTKEIRGEILEMKCTRISGLTYLYVYIKTLNGESKKYTIRPSSQTHECTDYLHTKYIGSSAFLRIARIESDETVIEMQTDQGDILTLEKGISSATSDRIVDLVYFAFIALVGLFLLYQALFVRKKTV